MSNSESFACFYTTQPFWAVTKPDIDIIKNDEQLFYNTLAEEVIKYNDDIFSVKVCRDGLIMVQIYELNEKLKKFKNHIYSKEGKLYSSGSELISKYLAYLNTIQLLLDSSMIKTKNFHYFNIASLTHNDIFSINSKGNVITIPNPPNNITQKYYFARELSRYPANQIIEHDERLLNKHVVDSDVFITMINDFKTVVNEYEKIRILSIVNTAVSEYNINLDISLIQSWFVIEYFLNSYWERFVSSKKLGKKRNEFLKGRDLTASIISNMLEMSNIIDLEIFKKIDNIRNKRNKIVHDLKKEFSFQDCLEAFEVLEYFIKNDFNINIKIAERSFGHRGLDIS